MVAMNGMPFDVDALISPHMAAAVDALDGPAPLLAGMGRYHLGWVDRDLAPAADGAVDRGKRIRPALALLCCAAAGGNPADAAPLAAAIELLHNFTLVHDDIQDHSPTRRHRQTVWTLWGVPQAINAGDALFAAAHLSLYRLRDSAISPELVLRLAAEFDRMTIAIVAGQVLDLQFEARSDVTPDDYLRMIGGKTAAIVRYAAWAGALIAGADDGAERFGAFGLALGVGFQIQDDLLGVWGSSSQTGKAAADDIRRKKQSLPILLLHERAHGDDAAELEQLYASPEIDAAGTRRVLDLLERYDVRREVERHVQAYHDQAKAALETAVPRGSEQATEALFALIELLSARTS
jgi:geranylgeranyl diphosphate synthase, type I